MTRAVDIFEKARRHGVNLVRFLYTDLSGLTRGKSTSLPTLESRIETGIGLVKGMIVMNCLDSMQTSTGFGATGEVRLVPDLDSFSILPYTESSASMVCDMVELDGTPWKMCPRNLLKSQIEKAAKLGYAFRVSFETEYMIEVPDPHGMTPLPIDTSVCFGTQGMNRADTFVSSLVQQLQMQGLVVEQAYPELGPGQHEISIKHAPPMEACNQYIVLSETLRGLALGHGLLVTRAPKPSEVQPGNGCHVHLSMWDESMERNLMYAEGGISDVGRSFIAGLLYHLPALVSLTCPSVNSYRRLKPRSWSSAFACWGLENREAAVRVPSTYWGNEEESTNIEIKCVDNTINPYLALAGIIASGLDGIAKKMKPPEPVTGDPADLTDDECQSLGIKPLPRSLKDALIELETDIFLMKTLGDTLAASYITVKESEVTAFARDKDFELAQHRMRY